MPQKRKRKRTRIRPGPFLVIGAVLVLVTGLLYSPLTSLSKASVIGAKPSDSQTIDGILSALNRIPYVMVNQRWVETRVQRIQAVEKATYSQNIFGRGRLEVKYRTPVARVKGKPAIGLDAGGVMFETDQLPDTLPIVIRPEKAKDLPMTLIGGFPAGDVASLAVQARLINQKDKLQIWFNKEGALCLTIGTGLVVLGTNDELDIKLKALKEMLETEPNLLDKLLSLNLTEPSHPAKTYKKQRE